MFSDGNCDEVIFPRHRPEHRVPLGLLGPNMVAHSAPRSEGFRIKGILIAVGDRRDGWVELSSRPKRAQIGKRKPLTSGKMNDHSNTLLQYRNMEDVEKSLLWRCYSFEIECRLHQNPLGAPSWSSDSASRWRSGENGVPPVSKQRQPLEGTR